MNNSFTGWCRLVCLAWVFCLRPFLPMNAADSLVWRAEKNQVDAQIESWPLSEVLESISSATGWQIYLEPDPEYTVTTRFHNLKPADALRRLLGELNFALLPQTNAPARLFIYRNSVHEATQLIRVAKKSRPETARSEEHTSELQSRSDLVCRLLLEKKKKRHPHATDRC